MDPSLTADFDLVRELSLQGRYDYIIVGSGLGGGVLARQLVEKKKLRVLLIEKGGLTFTTHCLNTSRPHWQVGSIQGPSQDNDIVYNATKQKVQTAQGSDPYVGGPVYCLGGRANVWGLYSPQIAAPKCKEYFPADLYTYLQENNGYTEAFNLITNESQKNGDYPTSKDITISEVNDTARALRDAIEDFYSEYYPTIESVSKVPVAPMAAEFKSPSPYQFPQGAYSTVDSLLGLVYTRNPLLTVLLNTEVINVSKIGFETRSLTARSTTTKRVGQFQAGKGIVLCAGTIGTAVIGLNSGIQNTANGAGKGLTDHEIWGVRFARKKTTNLKDPVKLQCEITVCSETALLNIAVNANTFLGRGSAVFTQPAQFFDHKGKLMTGALGTNLPMENFLAPTSSGSTEYDTVNVTIEYGADLSNTSKVLNTASPDPCIYISRPAPRQPESSQEEMQALATYIRNKILSLDGDDTDRSIPAPRFSLAGFGVVAHEVGTMRMQGPKTETDWVVDANHQVRDYSKLYVCDLSVFPLSPPANPSLTLVAMAMRLADKLG